MQKKNMKKIVLPLLLIFLLLPGISAAKCIKGKCKNGEGAYLFPDGSRYEGMFKNGRIEGEGTLEYSDKSSYTGSFVGGTPHGKGLIKYHDGTSYQGNFDNGTLSGKGFLYGADGSRYEGDFVSGLFHGKGTFTFPDGRKYEGDFQQGQFDGQGTLTSEESVLEVGYKEGQCVGKGTITLIKDHATIAGECIAGEFVYSIKPPLPKTEAAAENETEPEESAGDFEFKVYEPENFYQEPPAEEVFTPKDFSEAEPPPEDLPAVPENN